ncbi:hypothetical protein ACFUJR_03375 [Streptomyces sp. NPDC057271]|uniref:hypothetical protein n=1 Tax=unclassified Streptomyces TaxID=2593676 RepID=UPI003641BB4D
MGEPPATLTLTAPPAQVPRMPDRPATWLLALPDRSRTGPSTLPDEAAALPGLRHLLDAWLEAVRPDPEPTVTQVPCTRCGGTHGFATAGDDRVYFSLAQADGLVLYALADTPVGVGLTRLGDGADATALAAGRSAARRQAYDRAAPPDHHPVPRDRRDRPHLGLSYPELPEGYAGVVIWQRPPGVAPR